MEAVEQHDLGHGVQVQLLEEDVLQVVSVQLELAWRARQGWFPGTLVRWQGRDWEVVARREISSWLLHPWSDEETARSQVRLDAAAVAALAAAKEEEQRLVRVRALLLVLAPLVGLAPRGWLQRAQDEMAYPSRAAAWLSAWIEAAVGVVVGLDRAAAAFGGGGVLPAMPAWLYALGFVIGLEGVLRLLMLMSSDGPVGSLLSSPLLLFERFREPPSSAEPVQVRPDRGDGILELGTVVCRDDWQVGGWLEVRGAWYRLVSRRRERQRWLYRLERAARRVDGAPTLRWLMSPGPEAESSARAVRSSLDAGLELVMFAFAPADLQAKWAARQRLPVWSPTLLSALLEVIGGLVNLLGRPFGWLTAIDLLLLADGTVRVVGVLLRRGPVGSVLGIPWRSWYARRLG